MFMLFQSIVCHKNYFNEPEILPLLATQMLFPIIFIWQTFLDLRKLVWKPV